jgi:hypothetical protein
MSDSDTIAAGILGGIERRIRLVEKFLDGPKSPIPAQKNS